MLENLRCLKWDQRKNLNAQILLRLMTKTAVLRYLTQILKTSFMRHWYRVRPANISLELNKNQEEESTRGDPLTPTAPTVVSRFFKTRAFLVATFQKLKNLERQKTKQIVTFGGFYSADLSWFRGGSWFGGMSSHCNYIYIFGLQFKSHYSIDKITDFI